MNNANKFANVYYTQSKAKQTKAIDCMPAKTYTFMIMNAQLRKERNPARDARIHVRVNATN